MSRSCMNTKGTEKQLQINNIDLVSNVESIVESKIYERKTHLSFLERNINILSSTTSACSTVGN